MKYKAYVESEWAHYNANILNNEAWFTFVVEDTVFSVFTKTGYVLVFDPEQKFKSSIRSRHWIGSEQLTDSVTTAVVKLVGLWFLTYRDTMPIEQFIDGALNETA